MVVPRQGWQMGKLSKGEQKTLEMLDGREPVWANYLSPLKKIRGCSIYDNPHKQPSTVVPPKKAEGR